jgi:hypothetical protein
MKKEKIYKEIENIIRSQGIKKEGRIIDGNNNVVPNAIFTTSEQTDIWEMISDGMEIAEIIETIKKW